MLESNSEVKNILKREEVENKYKWNEYSNFSNDEEWEKEFNSFDPLLDKLLQLKGHFGDSVDVIIEVLSLSVFFFFFVC
jgi:oligoendopeptidase F